MSLTHIENLSSNVFEQLLSFTEGLIGAAQVLTEIVFDADYLENAQTTHILTAINNSPQLANYQKVVLNYANFEHDDTVELLADVISYGSEIDILEIDQQLGGRRICVDIVYASAVGVEDGLIQITNFDDSS